MSNNLITYSNTHIYYHTLPFLPLLIPFYSSFSDSCHFARQVPYKG